MNTVTLKKHDLIKRVQTNRDNHRALFEKAQEGFRKEMIKMLDDHLSAARANREVPVHIVFDPPQDHTPDYDRVLDMLNMSVDDVIEIEHDDFAKYVRDEWQWKNHFLANTSKYLGK